MSFTSEYKNRLKRRRREDARYAVLAVRTVLTSAAMIAAAVAFDLPGKIRERWLPKHNSVTQQTESQQFSEQLPELVSASQKENTFLPSTTDQQQPSISETDATGNKDAQVGFGIPTDTSAASATNSREQQDLAEEAAGQSITLDMSKKHQTIPLIENASPQAEYPSVRIIALKHLDTEYDLSSPDGMLVKDGEILISFKRIPNARIRFSLSRSGTRIVLRIEPQMALWADAPMPLTLKKITVEAVRTRRRTDRFFATLSDLRSEKASLKAWINAPVAKPLKARGEAKLRVTTIDNEIKQMESQVATVEKQVQTVNDLKAFAARLHKKTKLQFLVIGGEE